MPRAMLRDLRGRVIVPRNSTGSTSTDGRVRMQRAGDRSTTSMRPSRSRVATEACARVVPFRTRRHEGPVCGHVHRERGAMASRKRSRLDHRRVLALARVNAHAHAGAKPSSEDRADERTRSSGSSGVRCGVSWTWAPWAASTRMNVDCDVIQADGVRAPLRSRVRTSH